MDKETECMWTVPIFFSLYILGGMGYNLIVEMLVTRICMRIKRFILNVSDY